MNIQRKKRMALSMAPLILLVVSGCSGGPTSTAPIQISKSDLQKGASARATLILDNIEKLPTEQRQFVASVPKTADTLKQASSDPAIKQRMDSLGIHVK